MKFVRSNFVGKMHVDAPRSPDLVGGQAPVSVLLPESARLIT